MSIIAQHGGFVKGYDKEDVLRDVLFMFPGSEIVSPGPTEGAHQMAPVGPGPDEARRASKALILWQSLVRSQEKLGRKGLCLSIGHNGRFGFSSGSLKVETGKEPRFIRAGEIFELSSEGCMKEESLRGGESWPEGADVNGDEHESQGRRTRKGTKIEGWSRKSRGRLLKRALSVEWQEVGEVIQACLTYHESWPVTGPGVQRDLKAFRKRLEAEYPGVSGLWKKEFQERGAPHVHLLLAFPGWSARWDRSQVLRHGSPAHDELKAFRAWVAEAWHEVTGQESEEHKRLGVQSVEYVREVKAAGFYFAGYAQKARAGKKAYQNEVPPGFEHVGRFWGCWNVQVREQAEDITWQEFYRVRRVLVKLMEVQREERRLVKCKLQRLDELARGAKSADELARIFKRSKRLKRWPRQGCWLVLSAENELRIRAWATHAATGGHDGGRGGPGHLCAISHRMGRNVNGR